MLKKIMITNPYGVHLLIAQEIHEIAAKYQASIFLKNESGMASAENVTKLLSLNLKQGDIITVVVDCIYESEVMELVLATLREEE